MSRSLRRVTWALDPLACFWWALLILCLPIQWLWASAVAAALHETGHAMAVYLSGGRVRSIHIGITGASIYADCTSQGRAIFCSLAGPFASFLCLTLVRLWPLVALCGFVQGLYNLLPLYPMDGGRALLGVLRSFCRKNPDGVFLRVQMCFAILLTAFGFFAAIRLGLGLFAFFPVLPLLFGKIPCKESNLRLQ